MLLASSQYVDWSTMGEILGIGLLAGAGLVAVFSVGLVFLSHSGFEAGTGTVRRNPFVLAASVICFLIVVGGVAYGIDVMLAK